LREDLRVEPEDCRFARVSTVMRLIGVEQVDLYGRFMMVDGSSLMLAWFDRPCRILGRREIAGSVVEHSIDIPAAGFHWLWEERIETGRVRIRNIDTAGEIKLAARLGFLRKGSHPVDYDKARRIESPSPYYPESLRRRNIEGKVVAWLYVDAKGDVFGIAVRKSDDSAFAAAAIAAFRRWRFEPATREEQPTPFVGEYVIDFQLTD
jgi:TonB family protein